MDHKRRKNWRRNQIYIVENTPHPRSDGNLEEFFRRKRVHPEASAAPLCRRRPAKFYPNPEGDTIPKRAPGRAGGNPRYEDTEGIWPFSDTVFVLTRRDSGVPMA